MTAWSMVAGLVGARVVALTLATGPFPARALRAWVAPPLPIASPRDALALVRRPSGERPGALVGPGTSQHPGGEMLKTAARCDESAG